MCSLNRFFCSECSLTRQFSTRRSETGEWSMTVNLPPLGAEEEIEKRKVKTLTEVCRQRAQHNRAMMQFHVKKLRDVKFQISGNFWQKSIWSPRHSAFLVSHTLPITNWNVSKIPSFSCKGKFQVEFGIYLFELKITTHNPTSDVRVRLTLFVVTVAGSRWISANKYSAPCPLRRNLSALWQGLHAPAGETGWSEGESARKREREEIF